MRLAVVSHCFPPYLAGSGGMATYAGNLANALADAGIEVTVFCGAPEPSVIREGNLTIIRLPYTLSQVPPNFVWFQLQNWTFLVKELSKFKLIHSQSPENTICLLARSKSQAAKWVVTFHTCNQRELHALFSEPFSQWSPRDVLTNFFGVPIWEFFYRTEIKYADHYFFTARTNVDDYAGFYNVDRSKLTFIPNGVNLEEFSQEDQLNQRSENPSHIILFFGRLIVRKGADCLIRSMPQILDEYSDAKLRIIGEGPQEPRLRSLVTKLKLDSSVSIRGFVPRNRLIHEIRNCALVAFPSLFEVQCTSVLEAMACRKTVVAFGIPSMLEVISHMNTGYLIPEQDISKLAKGISFLLGKEKLRRSIGESAFTYVQREHDWKKLAKKYIKVYESLLS